MAHALLFDGVPYQKGDAVYTTKGGAISVTRGIVPSPATASGETADAMLTRLAHKFHASEHVGLKQFCDSVGVARVARLLEVRENAGPVERAAPVAPSPAPAPVPASRAVPADSGDPSWDIAKSASERAGLHEQLPPSLGGESAVRHAPNERDASAELASLATRRIGGDDGIQSSIDALFPEPPNAA